MPPPLPNIRDNSKTIVDIDVNFGIPYRASIWRLDRKFRHNWLRTFWENDVLMTSCYAILDGKVVNVWKIVSNQAMKQTANGKHSNNANTILHKMDISEFQNFEFLTPKNPKIYFFQKNFWKTICFSKFSKNRNICIITKYVE